MLYSGIFGMSVLVKEKGRETEGLGGEWGLSMGRWLDCLLDC